MTSSIHAPACPSTCMGERDAQTRASPYVVTEATYANGGRRHVDRSRGRDDFARAAWSRRRAMKTPPKRLLGPFASLFVGPTSVVLAPFPGAALRLSNRRLSKPGDVNAEPGIGTVTNGTKSQSSALRSPQALHLVTAQHSSGRARFHRHLPKKGTNSRCD